MLGLAGNTNGYNLQDEEPGVEPLSSAGTMTRDRSGTNWWVGRLYLWQSHWGCIYGDSLTFFRAFILRIVASIRVREL